MRWFKVTDLKMPTLTYFHASCANKVRINTQPVFVIKSNHSFFFICKQNGQIYFQGGVTEKNKRINHLYTIMLQVPKLADICWSKLIANYSNILFQNRKTLVDIGVPVNFIKRIN